VIASAPAPQITPAHGGSAADPRATRVFACAAAADHRHHQLL